MASSTSSWREFFHSKLHLGPEYSAEKPQNGLAGLKHFRFDFVSAIIAGLVLPMIGGSYVTISGPAAGLAPALFASMALLGQGNMEVGYPLLLGAIVLTGLVQMVLAKFRLAKAGTRFPAAVVEGMLCAIGLMIIVKQIPLILGAKFHGHEFWSILAEIPEHVVGADPRVVLTGTICLIFIFAMKAIFGGQKWINVFPPQIMTAILGLGLSVWFGLEASHRIQLPDNPFDHGIVTPNFRELFGNSELWWPLARTVLLLTLIDGVETLATCKAIDGIDPFKRHSQPNRTLWAIGASNIASGFFGGLTIIPGGVKSTANIMAGGRTQWANWWNAILLIVYLLLARDAINLLPMAALGAIIMFTGWKLCSPKVWRHVASVGWDQLLIFTVTVLVTVSTDLLIGIFAGLVVWAFTLSAFQAYGHGRSLVIAGARELPNLLKSSVQGEITVKNGKIVSRTGEPPVNENGDMPNGCPPEDGYHVFFDGPITIARSVPSTLRKLPEGTPVHIHYGKGVGVICHDALTAMVEAAGKRPTIFHGKDEFGKAPGTKHPMAPRVRRQKLPEPVVEGGVD